MTPSQITRFQQFAFDHEARVDKQGRLIIYELPSNDGGGKYEVAGITERYDHGTVMQLVELIKAQSFKKAEQVCKDFYVANTNPVQAWSGVAALEFWFRDNMLNRGYTGALKTMQQAVGVDTDGHLGPLTARKLALKVKSPAKLLSDLRAATEWYENTFVGARPNLRKGLVNRWNDRLAFAQSFL